MIVIKNRTGVLTRISQPGVFSVDVPGEGQAVIEDVVKKLKVPSSQGEIEVDDVISAFTIAKAAVQDFGRAGLEFEFESRKYFYGGSEELPVEDEPVAVPVKKTTKLVSADFSLGKDGN